jgi:HAD superfamily hydrolase (TIGR01459 family)
MMTQHNTIFLKCYIQIQKQEISGAIMIPQTTTFSEIIPKYDAFFIDIWGVVHDGTKPYPGVVYALNHLIATKKIIFLSNAPRPADVILIMLQKYGINATTDSILTSGDVVRRDLQRDFASKKIYHIGEDKNQDILRDISINAVAHVKDADLILLSAYLDDPEKDDKFDHLLEEAAELNLPLICANPDTYVPHGAHVRRCAGIFAARYKGKVIYYGKPHANIFEAAIERCGLSKDKILMIGDTLDTDVLGAKTFGIDVAMTLTGNGAKSYESLSDSYASPTWVIESISLS